MTKTIWHNLLKLINDQGLSYVTEKCSINANRDEKTGLVCLKYSVFSPKTHWVTRACRGTVLSQDPCGDWHLEAVGFERFFNLGEAEDLQASFDWSNMVVEEKWDGSLIKLFWHHPTKEWVVSTSGTPTGEASVGQGYEGTFRDLFWETVECTGFPAELWCKEFIYVYELITPYNKIVVDYKGEWKLRLLAVRDKQTLEELRSPDEEFSEFQAGDLIAKAAKLNGSEHEGFILKDVNHNRIKLKSPHYVSLHRTVNNGSPDWFFLWREGELDEFLLYFPHLKPTAERIQHRIEEDCKATDLLLQSFDGDIKEFALKFSIDPHFHFAMAVIRGKAESPMDFIRNMNPKQWERHYTR